jgi:hypothetical protein
MYHHNAAATTNGTFHIIQRNDNTLRLEPGHPPTIIPHHQHPVASPATNEMVSVSTGSNVHPCKGSQGNRYVDIPECCIKALNIHLAVEMFKSKFGCKTSRQPAQLIRDPKSHTYTIPKTTKIVWLFICHCERLMHPNTRTKIRFQDDGVFPPDQNRPFRVQIPDKKTNFFKNHFYVMTNGAAGANYPNVLKNKIHQILFNDPYVNSADVLLKLLLGCNDGQVDEEIQISLPQWFASNILAKGHESLNQLLEFIELQSASAIANQEHQDRESLTAYHVPHGPSIQSSMHFSFSNSYTFYLKPLPHGHEFESFNDFMSFYGFPTKYTTLCIPVSEDFFHGTNFNPDQVDKSNSCILFTSPAHLWALHQLLSSPTHQNLTIFSMDGMFSLRLLRSGSYKTVIMSCGFLDLNVHDHSRQSNVTRAFVPCVHCLSPAENAPAAYLCLHGLARIYKKVF